MGTPFPVFVTLPECQQICVGVLSTCLTDSEGLFVCQLNFGLFLGVIILAILTGMGIPVVILACYLTNGCRMLFLRRAQSDLERQQLNPRSVMISCSEDATASVVRRELTPSPLTRSHVRF